MTAVSPEAGADAAYALGLWTGWGVLHSVLATRRVKAAFELALGPRYALYPFFYSVVSVWTFWVVLQKEPDLSLVLWSIDGLPKIILYTAQGAGLALLVWAGVSMGGLKLLGLRQLWSMVRGQVPDEADMVKDFSQRGAYGLVRHPMHSGGMLFLLAAPSQTLGGLVFTVFGCAYMILGTLLEERRLALALGPVWEQYVSRVPMFVPFLAKRQN